MEQFPAWIHNLDPFAIQFWGQVGIRWYGLAYLCGFIAGYYVMRLMSYKKNSPLKTEHTGDLITYMVLGVMIGGRVGYALFYEPELLTDFRSSVPFWGVLAVWEGGMASHGGFIGVAVACWLFAKKYKVPFVYMGDLAILGASIGIFFGRMANFINGELIGRPVHSAVAWAVKFPQEMYLWLSTRDIGQWTSEFMPRLAALKDVASTVDIKNASGEVFKVSAQEWTTSVQNYVMSTPARRTVHAVIDQIIEQIQNGNETLRQAMGPLLTARHPSQIYAGLSEGLIPFLVILWLWRKPQKPGVISATFLALYPISRVINEFFRTPDAHLGFQWLGLTRGQWLSIAMAVVSFTYAVWAYKREVPKMGGWMSDEN